MKSKPNVTLSVKNNEAFVEVFKPDIVLDIRYYNVKDKIDDHPDLWTDDDGRQCIRNLHSCRSREEASKKLLYHLQSFTEDLKHHSGIDAMLEVSPSPDGLHVLKINNVDYYFRANNGGYDGWGKFIGR